MTLSTIERTLLKEKLMYILSKTQHIYVANLPANIDTEHVNALIDRRDHIMDKVRELINVIEQ